MMPHTAPFTEDSQQCIDLNDRSDYPGEDFNLIQSLAGNSTRRSYDFGICDGIVHLRERPWSLLYQMVSFLEDWRIQNGLHCWGRGWSSGFRGQCERYDNETSISTVGASVVILVDELVFGFDTSREPQVFSSVAQHTIRQLESTGG